MPAKDIFHEQLKKALIKDKWVITHDPLFVKWGAKDLYIDLGAEQFLGAEKLGKKIAVEVKSFIGLSEVEDLKNAVGQFILYHDILNEVEPERELYLAIRDVTFAAIFEEPLGRILLENKRVRLIVFNANMEVIEQWIN
jgi:XisH protein